MPVPSFAQSLPDWYTPENESAPVAPPPTPQPPQGAQGVPDWYTPEPATSAPVSSDPDAAPAQASTLGYIGSRLLGGFLEGGKQLGNAAAIEMSQPDQAADMASLPSGQDQANKMVYRTTNVPAPNAVARYGGDLAAAVGSNPVAAAAMPVATVAGSLGSTGASDINKATGSLLPDWLARLAGGLFGVGAGAAGAAGVSKLMTKAPETVVPDALSSDQGIKQAAQQMQKLPETRIGQFQPVAQDAAASLGADQSPATIGQTILNKAQSWLSAQKDAANKNFTAIEAQFPAGSRVQMPNTLDLLTQPTEGPPLDAPLAAQITARLNQNSARGLGETMPYELLPVWMTLG